MFGWLHDYSSKKFLFCFLKFFPHSRFHSKKFQRMLILAFEANSALPCKKGVFFLILAHCLSLPKNPLILLFRMCWSRAVAFVSWCVSLSEKGIAIFHSFHRWSLLFHRHVGFAYPPISGVHVSRDLDFASDTIFLIFWWFY